MRNVAFTIKKINWFFLILIVFALSFPQGESLISISMGLTFIVSLFYIRRGELGERLKKRKLLFFVVSIYAVYLVGCFFCEDTKWGLYDLKKCMAYFLIPLAFIFAKTINASQVKSLLLLLIFSIVISSVITLITFYTKDNQTVLSAQESGFIQHIRFSILLNFAMIVLVILFLFEDGYKIKYSKIIYAVVFAFLLLFMLWHQSFTGIITFLGTLFIGVILLITKLKKMFYRSILLLALAVIISLPAIYLYSSIKKYYNIDQVDYSNLEKYTPVGNKYYHDIENKQVENGHFIRLYICEKEMEAAWNIRSNVKYDEIGSNGYPVKETLIRYLTSLGLRKDKHGVESLSNIDIENINRGISNYILAGRGFSLYPRIYVSLWELDTYFKTGYANHQSLSQRIEYVKAALYIIKSNFWFGVGTGNWKMAYREAYEANKSKMNPARYGDAHNQYLNYMVKFGLVGLLWILFAIFYPVVKTKKYKNPIFLLFLISMLISNFGDSNLETHVGGAFFVFIYCLLLSSEDIKLKYPSSYLR